MPIRAEFEINVTGGNPVMVIVIWRTAYESMTTNPYEQFASQLSAVCDQPDEDEPRLRFAELLDATDDPMLHTRAEYIRVQCCLARPDLSEDDWADLSEREESLESKYADDWWASGLPAFEGVRFNPQFHRGFPYDIWCDDENALQKHATTLFASQPIQSLSFMKLSSTDFLRELEELIHIKSLILEDLNLGPRDAQNLAASPYLRNVSAMHFSQNKFGDDGARAIAGASQFTSLKSLDLGHNDIGDDGVIALAESDIVSNLEDLGLAESHMTDAGALALAYSPKTKDIEAFTFWHCYNVGKAGQQALEKQFGDRASFMD